MKVKLFISLVDEGNRILFTKERDIIVVQGMIFFLTIRELGFNMKAFQWHEKDNSYSIILDDAPVKKGNEDEVIQLFLQEGWKRIG